MTQSAEHVGFSITDGTGWRNVREKLLSGHEHRIDFEGYRAAKARAAKEERFFCWSGVNVFECMHPVSGHEHMLMGMLDEPEWIADMAACYADMTIELQQILFEREGPPEGIWHYEDMDPQTVEYDTLKYFFERGLELGTYR